MNELDRLGWAVQHTFRIGEAAVGIRTTSEAFGDWLTGALAAHREAADGPVRYSIVAPERNASRRREYDILYRGCAAIVRTLHRPTLAQGLLAELEAWRFPVRDDAVFIRMAPIAGHGTVALIPPHVATTLAGQGQRCARAGITLPAQLHVAVEPPSGAVIPIPPSLRVASGALERLGDGGGPDRLAVTEPFTAGALLFFSESGGDVSRMSRGLALHRIAGSAFNLPRLGGDGVRGLGRLVAGVQCFAVNAVEPAKIVGAVSQALRMASGG